MTPAQLLLSKFGHQLTPTQHRYVAECLEQAERGQCLSVRETSKKAHVSRESVAQWRKDPKFLWLATQVVLAAVHYGDVLVDRAVQVQAIGGRPSAVEANLRRRGLWNGGAGEMGEPGAPSAAAAVSVTFVGLPEPLSPAAANAMNPPPGSNKVLDVTTGKLV